MQITITKDFQGSSVSPQLQEFVDKLFSIRPSLEFVSCSAKRTLNDTREICEVEVFEDDQKVGVIGWTSKWSRVNGNEYAYRIYSRNIHNNRGDRHAKRTKSLASAMKIAIDVLVKDTTDKMAAKVSVAIKEKMNSVMWQVDHRYKDKKTAIAEDAIDYVIRTIEGESPAISDKILQVVQSDKFKEAQNNYRIAASVNAFMATNQGAIVFVDRKQRLTFINMSDLRLQRLESTYDLPKEYQEKFTILKIMENRQPVENVGIKISSEIGDEEERDYFYLTPGATVVTH